MVKIILPENLFMFLKVIGLFSFSKVEEFFTESTQEFSIFGYSLKIGEEVSINSSSVF